MLMLEASGGNTDEANAHARPRLLRLREFMQNYREGQQGCARRGNVLEKMTHRYSPYPSAALPADSDLPVENASGFGTMIAS